MITTPAKPLFVIGTARSGTTWLANMLANHPYLAGVTATEHQGIHESHLFSHTRYALTGRRTFAEFIEQYKEEDYFKLLRLDAEQLCESNEEIDVYRFFRILMEKYAAAKGARYWLEKTPKHSIYYQEILEQFPEALFVTIERRFEETLLSNLNKFAKPGAGRWVQVLEKIFRYESDMRAITQLKRRADERVVSVKYEDLVQNTNKEIFKILEFLSVPRFPLNSPFSVESSIKNGKLSRFAFLSFQWPLIRGIRLTMRAVPFGVMFWARKRRDLSEAKKFPKFGLFNNSEII